VTRRRRPSRRRIKEEAPLKAPDQNRGAPQGAGIRRGGPGVLRGLGWGGEENNMGTEDNKEILEALREVLVDRLKVEAEAVTPQANLFDDLGLDSIDLMSAVMAIEERFEIEVSDAELENVTTVGEAVEILGAKVAASA